MICPHCTMTHRECKDCKGQGWVVGALRGKTFCQGCFGQGRVRDCEWCMDSGFEILGLPLERPGKSTSASHDLAATEEGHLVKLWDPAQSVTRGIECFGLKHPYTFEWLVLSKPTKENPLVVARGRGLSEQTHLYVMLKSVDQCEPVFLTAPSSVLKLYRQLGGRVRNFLGETM